MLWLEKGLCRLANGWLPPFLWVQPASSLWDSGVLALSLGDEWEQNMEMRGMKSSGHFRMGQSIHPCVLEGSGAEQE